jgi:4-hydroxy-3-polyprenylbenzoate decarboxylase
MLRVTEMGATLLPPLPAFYFNPKTIDDLVNHTVGKVLDLFGIDHHLFERWGSSKIKQALKKKGLKN